MITLVISLAKYKLLKMRTYWCAKNK